MGTWGTAIFSDDLAADVRAEFRELIGDGLTPEQATESLIGGYSASLEDSDEATTLWIALAATQWAAGRLLPSVRDRALDVIDHGGDLHRWADSDPKTIAKRRAALAKLKSQLLSPPPKPRRIAKAFHSWTPWEIGHAIAYRMLSGRLVIMRVIGIVERSRGRHVIVELCDWVGDKAPDSDGIARLPRKHTINRLADQLFVKFNESNDGKFAIYSERRNDFPVERVLVVATGVPVRPIANEVGCFYFGGWSALDGYLKREYGLE